MAGPKSNYLQNNYLDWLLRAQTFVPPATTYMALFTVTPGDSGGGTEVSSSGTSYARVSIASTLANWAGTQGSGTTVASTGTSGTTSNNNAITFPAPTGNWGTVVAFGLFDASTNGNLLYWGPLAVNKTINNGDAAPSFAAAAFTLTED